jgi:trimethylamine--corrinoid protein Co-methyltransferase
MEAAPNTPSSTPKRARTVRASNPANAFRQEPPGLSRVNFGFLTDDEVAYLKARVEDVLADYGVAILHPEAHRRFLAAGAQPGRDANRIRMPRELIREAMAATPKTVRLGGKEDRFNIDLPRADRGFIMRTGTGAHGYVNPRDAKYRNMDLDAVNEIAAVANTLDEVGFIAHPFVHGVPEKTADIHSFGRLIGRTGKHIWMQPYQWENVDYLMKIAAIAAGGEDALRANPITSCITCSFTPLEFKYMDTHCIIKAGEYGVPLHACSLPSSGGTAPLSVASMAVMSAAEIVGMTVMAHILSPGTPVIATPLMFTLDMRTGSALQSLRRKPAGRQHVDPADETRLGRGGAYLRVRVRHAGRRTTSRWPNGPGSPRPWRWPERISWVGSASWNARPCSRRCRRCWTTRWAR